ncbi:MAG: tetratricopeptide repeat protein [Acidobacteriota bacterium]
MLAFCLLWSVFIAEFLLHHVRLAPASVTRLRRAELDLRLDPERGTARVRALLELTADTDAPVSAVSLLLPVAATDARFSTAAGRALSVRRRSSRRLYLSGRSGPGGRTWTLQRYAEPRHDVWLPPSADSRLRVEYVLEGRALRGISSLRSGRTLLAGSWTPRPEVEYGEQPSRFTYRLRVSAPAGERVVVSGALGERRTEGSRQTSEWSSLWPVQEVWVLSAPLQEQVVGPSERPLRIYVEAGRDPSLARQIGADALASRRSLEAKLEALPDAQWQIAMVENLGAISDGEPPLVLIEAGLYRRAAERPASIQEHRDWIAQEMARAWLRRAQMHALPQTSSVLSTALGSVLAQIAFSGREQPELAAAPLPDGMNLRVEWMMRCRAYAGEGAERPPLSELGAPGSLLMTVAKLPAVLSTIASQLGEAEFIEMVTAEAGGDLEARLAAVEGGEALAALLRREWLPDLSVESVESDRGGVRIRVADRGQALVPLSVTVALETRPGTVVRRRVRVPPAGVTEVRFDGVESWRRVEVDPERHIFQVEFENDVLPRAQNPWLWHQKLWDVRRAIARGQFEHAIEEAMAAARLRPGLRETDYWIGFALVKLGRGEEAISWLERASEGPLASDVVAVESLYQLGLAYESLDRASEARRFYELVIEQDWTAFSVLRAHRALERLQQVEAPSLG